MCGRERGTFYLASVIKSFSLACFRLFIIWPMRGIDFEALIRLAT